jgi:hypothetical protein
MSKPCIRIEYISIIFIYPKKQIMIYILYCYFLPKTKFVSNHFNLLRIDFFLKNNYLASF